eukprot:293530-Pleurochrysis_carterae.AAC.1
MVGLDTNNISTPATTFVGNADRPTVLKRWADKVKKHVGAVLRGRCDTDESARLVAKALQSSNGKDGIARLMQTPEFIAHDKDVAKQTLNKMEEHWTARFSVHVWDRLELSRSKMETL